MVNANLGSLATKILDRVDNIPTSISGALIQIVDEARLYAENYTGLTIGSTAIEDKYQPAIIDLAAAQTLRYMEVQGANVSSISLGDLSINKGQGSASMASADALRQEGIEKLKVLGRVSRFKQVLS